MEPSWLAVTAGLGPLAPFRPAQESAFAYERMQRSLSMLDIADLTELMN